MFAALPPLPPRDLQALAETFALLALQAGAAIMKVYGRCAAREKEDRSPVTEADEAAETIILEGLGRFAPDLTLVAEEAVCRGRLPAVGREFVLIDALDGTREFLKCNDEFTVNIGLIRDGAPCCGVVYAPAMGKIWISSERAMAAIVSPEGRLPPESARRPIWARRPPEGGLMALASRSHSNAQTEAFLARLPIAGLREGGSSIKFCLLAEGEADVYPRFSPTMEWDTAAGDAILRRAGGSVQDDEGLPLRYGKQAANFRNPGFVAWGAPELR